MIENLELLDFLARTVGGDVHELKKLKLETRLLQDLGLDGDDFLDLIWSLSNEYGCDVSKFESSRYCHSEADFAFPNFIIRYLKNIVNRQDGFEPVTLAMIAEALSSKRWPA